MAPKRGIASKKVGKEPTRSRQAEKDKLPVGNQDDSGEMSNLLIFQKEVMAPVMEVADSWQPVQEPSVFNNVGSSIPLKVKEKVWEGQYIDIASLLKSTRELQVIADNGPAGEITIQDGRLCINHAKIEPFEDIN